MTNNKLAAQCLIEAASILNESKSPLRKESKEWGHLAARSIARGDHNIAHGRIAIGASAAARNTDRINRQIDISNGWKFDDSRNAKYPRSRYFTRKDSVNGVINQNKDSSFTRDFDNRRHPEDKQLNDYEHLQRLKRIGRDSMGFIDGTRKSNKRQRKFLKKYGNQTKNEAAAECYLRAAQLLDESYDVYDDYDLY